MLSILFTLGMVVLAGAQSQQEAAIILARLPKFASQLSTIGYSDQNALDAMTPFAVAMNATKYNASALNETLVMTGMSAALRQMIMTKPISYFKMQISQLNFLFVPAQSLLTSFVTLMGFDTVSYTERFVIPLLGQILSLDPPSVRLTIISPDVSSTSDNLRFLSAVAPKLKMFIRSNLRSIHDDLVRNYFGSDSKLKEITGLNSSQLLDLNATRYECAFRGFGEKATRLSTELASVTRKLFSAITSCLAMPLKNIISACNMTDQQFLNSTLSDIVACKQLKLDFYIKSLGFQHMSGFYFSVTMGEYQPVLNVTLPVLKDMSSRQIEAIIRSRVETAEKSAENPIVAIGFAAGIKHTALPDMVVGTFFSTAWKLSVKMIGFVFSLSNADVGFLRMTFTQLSAFFTNEGVNTTVLRISVLKAKSSFEILREKKLLQLVPSVEEGIAALGDFPLSQIMGIYMLSSRELLISTPISLSERFAHSGMVEISKAFKLSDQQARLLAGMSFRETQVLNDLLYNTMLEMTLKNVALLALRTIHTHPKLLSPISKLFDDAKLNFYEDSLSRLLKEIYKGMEHRLNEILQKFKLMEPFSDSIFKENLPALAMRFKMSIENLQKGSLMSLLSLIPPALYPTNEKLLMSYSANGYKTESDIDGLTLMQIAMNVTGMNLTSIRTHSIIKLMPDNLATIVTEKKISYLKKAFCTLNAVFRVQNTIYSAFDSILITNSLDFVTKTLVPTLSKYLRITTQKTIQELISPDSAPNNNNIGCLVISEKIPGIVSRLLRPIVDQNVANYFGSEQSLIMLSARNRSQYMDLSTMAVLDQLRRPKSEAASSQLRAIFARLLVTLNTTSQTELKTLQMSCGLNDSLLNQTYDSISQQCAKYPSLYFIETQNNTDVKRFYTLIPLENYRILFGVTEIAFKEMTLSEIEKKVTDMVEKAENIAESPIWVLASRNNITRENLQNMTVANVLTKSLNLGPRILMVAFKMSESNLSLISQTKFRDLPGRFKMYNLQATLQRIITLSAESFLLLVRGRSHSDFNRLYMSGLNDIVAKRNITEVSKFLGITSDQLEDMTVVGFLQENADVSDSVLGQMFSVPLSRIETMKRVKLSHVLALFTIPKAIALNSSLLQAGLLSAQLASMHGLAVTSLRDILEMRNYTFTKVSLQDLLSKLYSSQITRLIEIASVLNLQGQQWMNISTQKLPYLETLFNLPRASIMEMKLLDILIRIGSILEHGSIRLDDIHNFNTPISMFGFSTQEDLNNVTLFEVAMRATGQNEAMLNETLARAGLSTSLRMLLMKWQIKSLRKLFFHFEVLMRIEKTCASLFRLAMYYDTEVYTRTYVVPYIRLAVMLSDQVIIRGLIAPANASNDDNLRFLSNLPFLRTRLCNMLRAPVSQNVKNFWQTESKLMQISGVSEEQLLNLTCAFPDDNIRGFVARSVVGATRVVTIYNKLHGVVVNAFGMTIQAIASLCKIDEIGLKNWTLGVIIRQCFNVPITYYYTRGMIPSGFFTDITVADYQMLLQIPDPAFRLMTLRQVELAVHARVSSAEMKALTPVSFLARENKIKFEDLTTTKIFDLVGKALPLTPKLIRIVFGLSEANLTYIMNHTFGDLPTLMRGYNIVASQNELYTMYLRSLLYLLSGKKISSFTPFVEQGMANIGTKYTFAQVLLVYDINLNEVLRKGVHDIAITYAGVGDVKLAAAFNITLQLEFLLKNITLGQAARLNKIPNAVFPRMTLKDIGLLCIRSVITQPEVFRTIGQILQQSNLPFNTTTLDEVVQQVSSKVSLPVAYSLTGDRYRIVSLNKLSFLTTAFSTTTEAVMGTQIIDVISQLSNAFESAKINGDVLKSYSQFGLFTAGEIQARKWTDVLQSGSSLQIRDVLKFLKQFGASDYALNLLQNRTILSISTMLPLVLKTNLPSDSLYKSAANIITYDTPGYFKNEVLPMIREELNVDNAEVSRALGTGLTTPYLSSILPLLRNLLRDLSRKKTMMELDGLNLTQPFQNVTGITISEYNNQSSDLFYNRLIGDDTQAAQLRTEIAKVKQMFVQQVVTFLNTPLSALQRTCNVSERMIMQHTVASLAQRCQNQSFDYYLKANNISNRNNLYRNFRISDLKDLTKITGPDVFRMTPQQCVSAANSSLIEIQRLFAEPTQIAFDRAKVTPAFLAQGSVQDVFNSSLGLHRDILQYVQGLSTTELQLLASLKFSDLGNLTNYTTDNKNFRVVTFEAIIKYIRERPISEDAFKMSLARGLGYIVRNLDLEFLLRIFNLDIKPSFDANFLALANRFAGVGSSDFLTAVNLSSNAEMDLGRTTLKYTMFLNQKSEREMLQTPLANSARDALEVNMKYRNLLLPLSSVLNTSTMEEYLRTNSLRNVLNRLLTKDRVSELYEAIKIDGDIKEIFEHYNITQFLYTLSNPNISIGSVKLVDVLIALTTVARQESRNKCTDFSRFCNRNAGCISEKVGIDCRCGSGYHGNGVQCFENVPPNFNVTLRNLAVARGIQISPQNNLVAILSSLVAVSTTRIENILRGLQVPVALYRYISTKPVTALFVDFPGFTVRLKNFDITSFQLVGILNSLESKETTEQKVKIVASYLDLSVPDIAKTVKADILNLPFLSNVNFLLAKFIPELSKESSESLVKDLGVTEQQFLRITKKTVNQLSTIRANIALSMVREDTPRVTALTNDFNAIINLLNSNRVNTLQVTIPVLQSRCTAIPKDLIKEEIRDVITKCFTFTYESVANFYKVGNEVVTRALGDLTLEKAGQLLNLTESDALTTNFSILFVRSGQRVKAIVEGITKPMSVHGFNNRIPFTSIPNLKILNFVSMTTSLSEETFQSLFSISETNIKLMRASTFTEVARLVTVQSGYIVSVQHLLTLSLRGLLNSLAAKDRNETLVKELTAGATYLATKRTLGDLIMVYGVSKNDALESDIVTFANTYAGLTPTEIQLVLRLSRPQELLLQKVKMLYASIILNWHDQIFNRTIENVGHHIVNLGELGKFFNTLDEILRAAGRDTDDLDDVTPMTFLRSARYTNLNSASVTRVLSSLNAQPAFIKVLEQFPISALARAMGVAKGSIGGMQLFTLLRSARIYFSSAGDKCMNFTCHPKAVCRSITNGVECNCMQGYRRVQALCHEIAPTDFQSNISSLAAMRGITINHANSIIMVISQVTNTSIARVRDIFLGQNASSDLVDYLNKTSIAQTIEQYYGLKMIYVNFSISPIALIGRLVYLNSVQVTLQKISIVEKYLNVTVTYIAEATGRKVTEIVNAEFFTRFNIELNMRINNVVINSTRKLITDRGLTDITLKARVNVTLSEFNSYRGRLLIAMIRENSPEIRSMTVKINNILSRISMTLGQSLAHNVTLVRMACAGAIPDFNNAQVQSISSNCLGYTFQSVAHVLNLTDERRRALVSRCSINELRDISGLTSSTFESASFLNILQRSVVRLGTILQRLGLPISYQSYRRGLKFGSLPQYFVINWAANVSGLSMGTIPKIFGLSSSMVSSISALTFNRLPQFARTVIRESYPINLFFTTSFTSLVQSLIDRKGSTVDKGTEEGASYMVKEVKLYDIKDIYGITRNALASMNIPAIFNSFGGISISRFQGIIKLTKSQVEVLQLASIEDAGIILNMTSTILNMTSEAVGAAIIPLSTEVVLLHDNTARVLARAGRLSHLENATVNDILTYGKIKMADSQRLFAGLNATPAFNALIAAHPLVAFAAPLGISTQAITNMPMIKVVKMLRNYFAQDTNKCANFRGCHADAVCSNVPDAVACTCKTGYSGNGIMCQDVDECKPPSKPCNTQATCRNTKGSYTCTCNKGYAGDGKTCSDVNECNANTHNCHVNAVCENTIGSFSCYCKSGLAGNGTTCYSACSAVQCPTGQKCYSLVSGTTCKCDPGFSYVNSQCKSLNSLYVTKTTLDEPFSNAYLDKDSAAYQEKKRELERDILVALNSSKVQEVDVNSITNGSIIVNYYIYLKPGSTVTTQEAQALAVKVINSPAMARYNPVLSVTPGAQKSDVCTIGSHGCGSNSNCVANADGSFLCQCVDGYEKDGDVCEKKRNIAVIVVPVVIVALILIFGITVLIMAYKKKRGESKLSDASQPYAAFRANNFEMDGKGSNNVYFKNVSDKE